jgi:hypothetical protein
VRALNGAWSFLHNHGEIRAAHQLADELAVLSGRRNDSDAKLITHKCLGVSHLFRGEFSRALHHLRQALKFYNQAEHRPPPQADAP